MLAHKQSLEAMAAHLESGLIETRKAANAARDSAEAYMNTERAWVVVTPGEPNPELQSVPELGSAYRNVFAPCVSNVGTTPTQLIESYGVYRMIANLANLPSEPSYGTPTQHAGTILAPKEPPLTSVNFLEPSALLTQEQKAAVWNHESFLYAHGFVRYVDAHKRTHETRYGYVYHIPLGGDPTPRGFRKAGPSEYNKAT